MKPDDARDRPSWAGARLAMQLAIVFALLLIASLAWGQTPTLVQQYYTGAKLRGARPHGDELHLPTAEPDAAGQCVGHVHRLSER